jgi:hypothetical protein
MSLPNTQGMVSVPNTYPDRIQVNFQYQSQIRLNAQSLCQRLQAMGFRSAGAGEQYRGEVAIEGRPHPIPLYVEYHRRLRNLNIYAEINPLRDIRSTYRRRRIVERSINRDRNWLHARQIQEDNSAVVTYANDILNDIENRLVELVSDILPGQYTVQPDNVRGMFVHSAEIAIDFASTNPLQQIDLWREAFRRHFRSVHQNGYRDTARVFDGLQGDIPLVHGYSRQQERYKIYPKTNRRVRLECQVGARAMKRMGVRRNLNEYPQGFIGFYRAVARQVIPHFNRFLADTTPIPEDNLFAFDFLVRVGNATRDVVAAQDIVRILIREGRVTSGMGSRRLTNLTRAGLLVRAERGIYAPAPHWRSAIGALSRMNSWNISECSRRAS